MKDILIAAKNLKIGGIERSLINLINYLRENGYNITLVLEERKGRLLKEIESDVRIIRFKTYTIKFTPLRKLMNFFKQLKFRLKYRNKFDTSISYATYSKPDSFVARIASNNSILWCHADYLDINKGDIEQTKEFFENIYYDEFSKIVFVSKSAKDSFLQIFPKQKNVYYCNNFIDSNKIFELAKEKIHIKYNQEITTFLNVSRHDENQKKLSRIIKASSLLKRENYKFRLILVGSGNDTQKYKYLAEKNNISNNIIFEGSQDNPYPYYKISDCTILSSDYEGYPVVYLESFLFNKPIITTDVSDYKDIQAGRGIVTTKSTKGIYKAMKEYLDRGYKIEKKFDPRKYNYDVEKQIKKILKNG